MIEIRNLALPLSTADPGNEDALKRAAATRLGLDGEQIASVRLLKRSVDARRKSAIRFVVSLGVTLDESVDGGEVAVVRRVDSGNVLIPADDPRPVIASLAFAPRVRPVVVGTGPAGLFAALVLARAGARPLVLERGEPVGRRVRTVDAFIHDGVLDVDSNIQF